MLAEGVQVSSTAATLDILQTSFSQVGCFLLVALHHKVIPLGLSVSCRFLAAGQAETLQKCREYSYYVYKLSVGR
jgi:hypothetical protein